jgi:type II secretory pathway component PulK
MRMLRSALRPAPTARAGFALLAVLWIMVAAGSLGLTITLAARESVAAARNRTSATRAMWRAHDCLERARVAIDQALHEPDVSTRQQASPWLLLDSVVAQSGISTNLPCRVEVRAAGTTLDVNAADADMLGRLLHAAGIPAARVDSMTDALLDWRDSDDITRPLGVERGWYAGARRATPRNAALASDREIALVRGFDSASTLDGLLSVESARIVLPRAPLAVLAALPGLGEDALARVAERRLREAWPTELIVLAAELSPSARATLLAHYSELARLTTVEPDAWIVTSFGRDGSSPVTAVIEARLVRAGARAAIVRRRSWVE